METAAEEPTHHVPGPEVGRPDDLTDTIQDDEFDFEISGGDDLGRSEELENARDDLTYQSDSAEVQNGDSYMLHPQEQGAQVSNVESHHEESLEYGHEDIDLVVPEFDAYVEEDEYAQDVRDDGPGDYEAVDQDENQEERVEGEDGSQEGIDYEETAGEFDGLDTVQPELDQDHNLLNAAASADSVHDEVVLQELTQEARPVEDRAEAGTDTAQEVQYFEEAADDDETAGALVGGDHTQNTSGTGQAENSNVDSDVADTSPVVNDHTTEVVDESLDQSNWDAEDYEEDKDQHSDSFPNVTVSYQGQEYFLFGETADEDPNTYFLSDVDLIHQSLSQFLSSVREVISSELELSQEIFLQVDGLGLEFGESTTQDFLNQTTFAQIIEVNKRLVQHDGGSQSPELYIYLTARSNPVHRFADLVKGADEGQGLSRFEKYYEDDSGNASAMNEGDQHDISQDIISDDLSLDDANDEGEEVMSGAVESHDVQQTHNPFRVTANQEQSSVGASVSDNAEEDAAEYETDMAGRVEVHASDAAANAGSALETTDVHEVSVDDITEDGPPVSGQFDIEVLEVEHDVERQYQGGQSDAGEIDETEQEAEVLANFSQEGQEGTDDTAANTAEDDDYLDLGHEGDLLQPEDHSETTNGEAAIHIDTSRQVSDSSSATATLDGEDSAHGDGADVAQASAYPTQALNQTHLDTHPIDEDEIDWNHDEDDEIGVAHQNPTDLSPSSISAKRSRQEDEDTDGLGDENAAKRRRTEADGP